MEKRIRLRLRPGAFDETPGEPFVPQFDGVCSGWAFKFARRNLWRCIPDHDIDDLLSEARICFCKCVEHYPAVTDPRHFFALFRTAYFRRVQTIAANRTKRSHTAVIPFSTLSAEPETLAENAATTDGGLAAAELAVLKSEAPPHIATLISLLVDAHMRPRRVLREYRNRRRRESVNSFLCHLAGRDLETTNMQQEVMAWLRGRDPREFAFRRLPAF